MTPTTLILAGVLFLAILAIAACIVSSDDKTDL